MRNKLLFLKPFEGQLAVWLGCHPPLKSGAAVGVEHLSKNDDVLMLHI